MKAAVYQNLRIKSLSRFVTALMKAEQKTLLKGELAAVMQTERFI